MMSQETIQDKSSKGNYYTTGEEMTGWIGGHPYVITPQHLQKNRNNMYLGTKEIHAMEEQYGSMCGAVGCEMKVEEHGEITALKVFCKIPMYEKPTSY